MATPSDFLQSSHADWLVGYDPSVFRDQVLQASQLLQPVCQQHPARILLSDRYPVRFLAHFIAAASIPCHLFLTNPDWTAAEWQQVLNQVQPHWVWQDGILTSGLSQSSPQFSAALPDSLILIPTGGSSGTVRFVMHTWETLMAAVQGFQQYFERSLVNAVCVLPLHHVSGLMQALRTLTSGGRLVLLPFRTIAAGEGSAIDPTEFFLSLVPTQLQRLLHPTPPQVNVIPWLSQFQTVLLGGAPAWADLLETARRHKIRLAPTYGMTETASQIATLKPDEFLNGQSGCGQILPHASVTICSSDGEALAINQTGRLTIAAQSLALGYYPHPFNPPFQPDDLGFLDEQGYLHLVGRQSDKIITGGENVFPIEVEAAIRATGLVSDVCVVGVTDDYWGQVVSAVYVPTPAMSVSRLKLAVESQLSKFKCPKHWVAVPQLPRNAQGKVNRTAIVAIVTEAIRHATAATTEPGPSSKPSEF